MKEMKISQATIERLSFYLCCLDYYDMNKPEVAWIQSKDIAGACGIKPSLVRKDLAIFGEFGHKGKGYSVRELKLQIMKILRLEDSCANMEASNIILMGVGSLGHAVLKHYSGNNCHRIAAGFDIDEALDGKEIYGVRVYHTSRLMDMSASLHPIIGIICVPVMAVQEAADMLMDAGVKGIISYIEAPIELRKGVLFKRISLSANLNSLMYYIRSGEEV